MFRVFGRLGAGKEVREYRARQVIAQLFPVDKPYRVPSRDLFCLLHEVRFARYRRRVLIVFLAVSKYADKLHAPNTA